MTAEAAAIHAGEEIADRVFFQVNDVTSDDSLQRGGCLEAGEQGQHLVIGQMVQEAAQQHARGLNTCDVLRCAHLALKGDTWPLRVTLAREADRYVVGVDALVAREA